MEPDYNVNAYIQQFVGNEQDTQDAFEMLRSRFIATLAQSVSLKEATFMVDSLIALARRTA
jgi:uncharacterized protein YchJ